jgi:hypothetical protein
MARTTLDIAEPILEDLRALQKREGRSLGSIASELIAEGLASRRARRKPSHQALAWISRDMGAPLVDIDDKEALHALLDQADGPAGGTSAARKGATRSRE